MKLRYRVKPSLEWVYLEFPDGTDELAVLEHIRTSMFPGVAVLPWVPVLVKPEKRRRK